MSSADLRTAQHFLPKVGQVDLQWRLSRCVAGHRVLLVRQRQSGQVNLAVGSQWQAVEEQHAGWHHVRLHVQLQRLLHGLLCRLGITLAGQQPRRHQVGQQLQTAILAGGTHHRLVHIRQALQARLDLPGSTR